jgi:hypothetical protein
MSISQNFPDEGPTLDLNFAGTKQLDPRVTFSRTTTATYMDDNGLIVTVPANTPRFEHRYNGTEIENLGLLIEEQRTNLLLQSESFNTSPNLITNGSITANITSAPDGSNNADKLVENASTGNKEIYQVLGTITSGTHYTVSVFAKAAERTLFRLAMDTVRFGVGTNAFFNLSSGTVTTTTGGVTSTSIIPYPNGWYRCTATFLPTSTGNSSVYITLVQSGTTSDYTGNGTSGIFLWGAQVEVGSFPTSYIPTTTTTVTRSRDDASLVGTNFTNWYRQSEGTIVCIAKYAEGNTTNQTAWSMYNGSIGAIRQMMTSSSGTNRSIMQVEFPSGTYPVSIENGTSINRANLVKTVCAFKTDDYALSMSGTTATTDTSGTMSNHVNLYLGSVYTGTWILNGTIAQLIYYPIRLSNTQIQTLSA